MKNKKILALTLATIIASGSINQMAMQVYAHDESLMAELSSTVESSHALPLKKFNVNSALGTKFCKLLSHTNEENLAISNNNQLLFEIKNEAEAELVCYCGTAESVDIPQKVCIYGQEYDVTSIGESAFQSRQNLESVNLPDGITKIGKDAFGCCTNLRLAKLPDSVTEIGMNAFAACKELELTNLPNGITKIPTFAFFNCTNLKLKELPDNVTEIGEHAFSGCTKLQLKNLPNGITKIPEGAFSGCHFLQLTNLPDGVTEIGKFAFNNCRKLELKNLPNDVTEIGEYAFSGCEKLQLKELPDNVIRIHNRAFDYCENLQLTKLPDNVTKIGISAFYNCTNLNLDKLPDNVTEINKYAFQNCPKLKLTKIPDGVTEIGIGAFYNTNIESIDIPASVTKLGEHSFETKTIEVINRADNSNLTNNDLSLACGRYFQQTNYNQYLKRPIFRQIEKDEIIDKPCPICCRSLKFNADNDNGNNIVDLPCTENHHYMHRDCYNNFIKGKTLTDEIENEVKKIISRRKIAQGLKTNNLIGSEEKTENGTLDELYTEFLAGKKRGFFHCPECKQVYPF